MTTLTAEAIYRDAMNSVCMTTLDLLHQLYWVNDRLQIVAPGIVRLYDDRLAVKIKKVAYKDIGAESKFWKELRADTMEHGIYIESARQSGYDVKTIFYDVKRIPSLRPLKATPQDMWKYMANGRLYANQRDTDELPSHFGSRVYQTVAADPQRYFRREEIEYKP